MSRRTAVISAALLFFLLVPVIYAQHGATVQGTVTDSTGAVVPGASVTVTSLETGQVSNTTDSDTGYYRVSGLAPGRYTVKVDAKNFKSSVTENVQVSAEAQRGVDVVLQPGPVETSVTVSGEAVTQVATENANTEGTITTAEVRRLPQFGRDPYNLIRLNPGIFGDASRQGNGNAQNLPGQQGPGGSNNEIFQVENQVQVVANGQRVSANNYEIDGVSVNSLGNGGAAVITPNEQSVKELRVVSNPYSAEYGRNSGAQVEVISQNGTNRFHGGGFGKFNDAGLNAFNKFYGPNNIPLSEITCNTGLPSQFKTTAARCPQRVEQKYRQFGGNLGGHIVKDKLFFFGSYEGLRSRNTSLVTNAVVETAQFRQYVIKNKPGSLAAKLFSTPGIEPRIENITKQVDCCSFDNNHPLGAWYTAGNAIGVGQAPGNGPDGSPDWAQADLQVPNTAVGDQGTARLDYNRSKDQFFVSGFFTRKDDLQGGTRPVADITFQPKNYTATVSWVRGISNTLLNEARGNFTRFAFNQVNSSTTNWGIPLIRLFDFDAGGLGNLTDIGPARSATTPAKLAQNTYEFRDTLNWSHGRHAFKFGASFRREQDNNNQSGNARPDYQFRGLLNLGNDACCFFEGIDVNPLTGGVPNSQRYFRTNNIAAFVQDDWKLLPNLTLNLGLRWEYFAPPTETQNRMSNYVFGSQGLINGTVPVVKDLFDSDLNNFGPRIGFAWLPYKGFDRVVVRGGFGVQYNRPFGTLFTNIRQNTPFTASAGLCCFFDPGPITGPPPGSGIQYGFGSSTSPFSYAPNPNLAFGVAPDGALCANKACTSATPVDLFGSPKNQPTGYVYSYSTEIQYEVVRDYLVTFGFQGSDSHKLARTIELNRLIPGDTFDNNQDHIQNASADGRACGPTNPACTAAHPTGNARFNRIFFVLPDVDANYNSLIARASHRFASHFLLDAIYTWSKSLDNWSFDNGPQQLDPSQQNLEYGPSDYDVRHNITVSGLWDLPIFQNRKDALGMVLGGWQLNTIITRHTGFPYTPVLFGPTNNDPNGDAFRPDRPKTFNPAGGYVANPSTQDFINGVFPGSTFRGSAKVDPVFLVAVDCSNTNTCNTTVPRGPGGISRNGFRGPGYVDVDFSVVKQFALPSMKFLGEGSNLEVRANLFNAFNLLNLQPFNMFANGDISNTGTFGRAAGGLAGRVVELQARFTF
jgi:hypothetical protein